MAVGRVLSCVVVLLVVAVALVECGVKPLPGRSTGPWVQSQREFKHTPIQEVLKELENLIKLPKVARARRESGTPVTDGQHQFGDSYQFARIHYSGEQSNAIFVLTYDLTNTGGVAHSNLYRSVNYGTSFENIQANLDGTDPNIVLWPNFYVSDFNKNMLVFPSAILPKLYYTVNEGDDWHPQSFTPTTINPRTLRWNPREDRWMIAHDSANDHLYVTQDLGLNWVKIADFVNSSTDYQWGDPDVDTDHSVVYYNTYDPDDANRGDNSVHLYTQRHPYDSGDKAEVDPNLGKHDGFLLIGPYIFVQQTDAAGTVSLLVSYNRKRFNKAMIPASDPHVNYLVAHINSLQALVIVEHESSVYNLYLSEITGVYYSLSLPDIVLEPSRALDLELIEGVNGTLVANQYVRSSPDVTNPPIRTLITLDNGGNWELVRPPAEDINNIPTNCQPPLCSLHFHMGTSEYARLGVYSQDSAPGIIIAHGNIGEQLLDNPDLYISRDGGNNWEETLTDSWGVTVADHGGLIVVAKDYHQNPSSEIKYSCDEGFSWHSYIFGQNQLVVYGVITEPGEHTTVVSLYGVRPIAPLSWEVITINFTAIFDGVCTASDYYNWRPWDEYFGEDCILGSSIEITRRLQDRCCLNGNDFVRTSDYTICKCEAEDFECDYGYERADGFTGACVLDPEVLLPEPCDGGAAFYMQSRGYRKIAGDVCVGGDESSYAPTNQSCCKNPVILNPSGQKKSSNTKTIAVGVILMVVALTAIVLFGLAVVFACKHSKLRRRYLRLATEPQESRFAFHNSESDRESSPEPERLLQIPSREEEDDDPILP